MYKHNYLVILFAFLTIKLIFNLICNCGKTSNLFGNLSYLIHIVIKVFKTFTSEFNKRVLHKIRCKVPNGKSFRREGRNLFGMFENVLCIISIIDNLKNNPFGLLDPASYQSCTVILIFFNGLS